MEFPMKFGVEFSTGRIYSMGVIEDTRQLIQDFLAPELREIRTRLDAMEEVSRTRFESIVQRLENQDKRLNGFDDANRIRFEGVIQRLEQIQQSFAFDKRISELEADKRRSA
jgi:hypothetical protein